MSVIKKATNGTSPEIVRTVKQGNGRGPIDCPWSGRTGWLSAKLTSPTDPAHTPHQLCQAVLRGALASIQLAQCGQPLLHSYATLPSAAPIRSALPTRRIAHLTDISSLLFTSIPADALPPAISHQARPKSGWQCRLPKPLITARGYQYLYSPPAQTQASSFAMQTPA